MTALNPELRRNLWLELTLQRLVAGPVILGLVCALLWEVTGGDLRAFASWLDSLFALLVLLWGTRRAAAALLDEVEGRTWDGQRLSALGAWPMAWGKLLGGTAFVWFCAAIVLVPAVAALAAAGGPLNAARYLAAALGIALLAQAVALLVALLLLRRTRRSTRGIVTAAQVAGIVAGLALRPLLDHYIEGGPFSGMEDGVLFLVANALELHWHGVAVDADFWLASLVVFVAWAVLGCHRLMRVELQYRVRPLAWVAFLVFVVIYLSGFAHVGERQTPLGFANPLMPPVAVLIALVYVGLFTEPRAWASQRAFVGAVAALSPARTWASVPLWVLSLAALAIASALLLGMTPPSLNRVGVPSDLRAELPGLLKLNRTMGSIGYMAALLLFVLRDALLFQFLTLGDRVERAGFAMLVYLGCLYGLSGALIVILDLHVLKPVFFPVIGNPLVAVLPPLLEVLLLAAVIAWRWRARVAALQAP